MSLPWRWRSEAGATLEDIGPIAGVAGPAGDIVAAVTGWCPEAAESTLLFELPSAEFLVAARLTSSGPVALIVEYCVQGGAGESAVRAAADWFPVADCIIHPGETPTELLWPDVGAHCQWRLRATEAAASTKVVVHALMRWHWQVRLNAPSAFACSGGLDKERLALMPEVAVEHLRAGELVVGDNALLSQLYHESDLLGWGSPIPFPCFMTSWAKPATRHDFASLIHRFERLRPPLLLLSGTSVTQRERLRVLLKSLLRPELLPLVADLEDPDAVIERLWSSQRAGPAAADTPTLAEVNRRLQAIEERLALPSDLRRGEYACQFHRRDPLMLLMTREAFGTWAPNRVATEIGGHDIFRTYAEFSCIDGVICAEDAVWLHRPQEFYRPAPDPALGDKRPPALLQLLQRQRPYIDALLSHYAAQGLLPPGFREGLEGALLAMPS